MQFRYRVPIIIHLVILLCALSQGMGMILLVTSAQLGLERSIQPRPSTRLQVSWLSMATLSSEQGAVERPAQRTLSSEAENVLLLLLGIVLLLTFTATKLWSSKNEVKPTKLDDLKN